MNSNNDYNVKYYKGVIYIILGLWVWRLLTFLYKLPQNQNGIILGVNYNYFVYLIVVASGFLVFKLCGFIAQRIKRQYKQTWLNVLYTISFIAIIVALYIIYDKETENSIVGYDWHLGFIREDYPHLLFTTFMLGIIFICGTIIKSRIGIHISIKYLFAVVLAFLGGVFTYAPNPFKNEIWGVYHTHAYTNSIVHVMNLEPYDDIMKSIYGHYAMVYFPFVRLFGRDYYAIAITIALFATVMYFCAFYVLVNIIKDDLLCVFSMIAVLGTSITFMGKGEYFQIIPHRCFFPMVVLAFIVWHIRHRSIRYVFPIGCLLLGTFSILFNLETGLVCAVVLTLAAFFDKSRKGFIKWVAVILLAMIFCAVCLVGAYLLVNAYNLRVDGEWNDIQTFIFPIASQDYNMQEILRTPIPKPLTGYIVHVVVFMISAFVSFGRIIKCSGEERDDSYIRFMIATCGMGVFTYYINRTVGFGLSVSHIQLIMLLTIYADTFADMCFDRAKMKEYPEMTYDYLFSMIAFSLVMWFAIEGIIATGNIIENHRDTVWDKSSLEADIEDFNKWKPNNVPAMGIGIPELYYQIGEETGLVLTDWGGTIDHTGFKKLGRFLEKETDEIIIGDVYAIEWALEDYKEVDRFEGENFKIKYYKKK